MHNANIWSSIILILSVEVTLKGPVDQRNGMVMNLTVLCLKMKVWVLKSTASCLQVYSKCAEICAYPWQAYPTTAGPRPIGLGLTLMWIGLFQSGQFQDFVFVWHLLFIWPQDDHFSLTASLFLNYTLLLSAICESMLPLNLTMFNNR